MLIAEIMAQAASATFHVVKKEPPKSFGWSASQVSNFQNCRRKWWFDSVEKKPRIERKSTFVGSLMHLYREEYLRSGQQPNSRKLDNAKVQETAEEMVEKNLVKQGQDPMKESAKLHRQAINLCNLGLNFLPMAQMVHPDNIEIALTVPNAAGILRGYIDVFMPDQGAVGYRPVETAWPDANGIPLVIDHKSTKNLQLVKTVDKLLREDPQPALYGAEALYRTNAPRVDFMWHYAPKEGEKKAYPQRFSMSAGQIHQRFGEVQEIAKEMLTTFNARANLTSRDVEPNPSKCDMYGGCPHRDYCYLTEKQKIGAMMSATDSDFMAMLDQQIQQHGVAQPTNNPALAQLSQEVSQMQNGNNSYPPNYPEGFANPQAAPVNGAQQTQQQMFGNPPNMAQPAAAAPQVPGFVNGQAAPVQAAPMQAAPMQAAPVQAAPAQAAPAQAAPAAAAPAAAQPTLAEMGGQLQATNIEAPPGPSVGVTPPDAAEADLNATVDEKSKEKAEKKLAKAAAKDKEFIRNAALQIYLNRLSFAQMSQQTHGNGELPHQSAEAAVNRATFLYQELKKKSL